MTKALSPLDPTTASYFVRKHKVHGNLCAYLMMQTEDGESACVGMLYNLEPAFLEAVAKSAVAGIRHEQEFRKMMAESSSDNP